MIPPVNISPEARDITFRDSCNCCFPERSTPSSRVYVSSIGEVVLFDKNKTKNESEAIVRSIDNLARIVHRMIEDRKIDKIEILEGISDKIKSLQQNSHAHLTREVVEDIVFQIQSSPKRHK